ncbi:MAG: hypothetical protein C6W56_06205 [Caldibacillus debilis]|nr:MAG: hypothetical protein C6W56_06205 [Caldibacillus debilis]
MQGEGDPKERRPAAATARLPNTGLPGKEIRPSSGNTHGEKGKRNSPFWGRWISAGKTIGEKAGWT